ncbi:hypothetical protein KRMM14A1259_46990 [Krasilnikovia sp. MM14-A1259]
MAGFDQAAADRAYVRYLAHNDPRSLVRTAAWSALTSNKVDATVARFLNTGLAYAVSRSEQLAARDEDFARRVLATHTVQFAPEVHAAAQRALDGGPEALEAFARTGYDEAMQQDRAAREAAGMQAAALAQADRDAVARRRDSDPGAQVRAAAGLALRAGATDADVVEFFAYDWLAAASVDLQTHQVQYANADMVSRAATRRLLADAQAADQAVQAAQAAGQDPAPGRAAAAAAWHKVAEQAGPARTAWENAGQAATVQAANWQQIAQAAADAAGNPNWQAIAAKAKTMTQQWGIERDNAAAQAAYWAAVSEQAIAGEQKNTQP